MTLRRLRVLINGLPPESAPSRKLRGDPWGPLEHLIADVFDVVAMGDHNLLRAQGAKPRKPKAHPRPTDAKPSKIGGRGEHSQEEVLTFLQSLKPPPMQVASERVPAAGAVRGAVLLDPAEAPAELPPGGA